MKGQCTICLESLEFNIESILSSTRCGHVFHQACIQSWLSKENTCPQCRAQASIKSIQRLFVEANPEDSLVEAQDDITEWFNAGLRKFRELKKSNGGERVTVLEKVNTTLLQEKTGLEQRVATLEQDKQTAHEFITQAKSTIANMVTELEKRNTTIKVLQKQAEERDRLFRVDQARIQLLEKKEISSAKSSISSSLKPENITLKTVNVKATRKVSLPKITPRAQTRATRRSAGTSVLNTAIAPGPTSTSVLNTATAPTSISVPNPGHSTAIALVPAPTSVQYAISVQNTGVPSSAASREDLQEAALRDHPEVHRIRASLKQNPGSLAAILDEVRKNQPQLLQLISTQRETFIKIINEQSDDESSDDSEEDDNSSLPDFDRDVEVPAFKRVCLSQV